MAKRVAYKLRVSWALYVNQTYELNMNFDRTILFVLTFVSTDYLCLIFGWRLSRILAVFICWSHLSAYSLSFTHPKTKCIKFSCSCWASWNYEFLRSVFKRRTHFVSSWIYTLYSFRGSQLNGRSSDTSMHQIYLGNHTYIVKSAV